MKNLTSQLKMFAMAALITSSLAACVNDTTTANNTTATTTSITGVVVAGAVTGDVIVSDSYGTQLATAPITNGSFTVALNNSDLNQALDFEATGTYTDEVSRQAVTLTAANPLALSLAANHFTAGQAGNAPITADTSIIRAMVKGGTPLATAETTFQTVFGYKPDLSAKPFDPYTTTITTQTTADKTAAFNAGMFSQLGTDLGLSAADLAELPNKFAADLKDGTFDGFDGANPVAFGSGVNLQTMHQKQPLNNMLSISLAKFAGSPNNIAGVAPPTMGLPPIVADMPGSTKAITLADGTVVNMTITDLYTAPFQKGFRSVKTTHQITLTEAGTGLPVDITAHAKVGNISVKPWMYMFAGHQHGTPYGAITQTAAGTYLFDAYYMMPTGMMMNGSIVPMGQWSIDVTIGDSSNLVDPYAHGLFFPNVMMNMGADLLLAKGSNAADQWTDGKGVTKAREYRVWLQDVVANPAGGHDLTVHVSTVDMFMNMMTGKGGMSFPTVNAGQVVHAKNGMMFDNITLNSVTCEASIDGGSTWAAMTAQATNGQYKITGLGLTTGTVANIDIRLTVNSTNATTNITSNNIMQTAAGGNLQLSFTAP